MELSYSQMSPYDFWNSIGSPKFVLAPMVDQSELSFRLLTRKYGTELTYTPMINSVLFSTQDSYRETTLKDISAVDSPSFVQFCGHDPEMLLRSAKYVENLTPCVDLNLGCPQGIARRGYYGAYLLENVDQVLNIIGYLVNNLKCGVSAKIRLFKDIGKTVELTQSLEKLGIKVITIHGRTKEEKKDNVGKCNWDAIKLVKESISIPVIANGGLQEFSDIQKCFDYTKCDAVMSGEKLLEMPFFFNFNKNQEMYNIDSIALEYLMLCQEHATEMSSARSHLFKFYYQACQCEPRFNQMIAQAHSYEEFLQIGNEIKDFRMKFEDKDKFGWYYRYRKKNENEPTDAQTDEVNIGECFENIFG